MPDEQLPTTEDAGGGESPADVSTDAPAPPSGAVAAPPSEPESPDDFKPPPAELVVRAPEDVFRAMDRADEDLILDEIQGRALEVLVYDFKSGGKRFTDLSVAGVNECVRVLNERGHAQIRIAPRDPLVEEFSEGDRSYYRVMVYAEDTRGGGSQGTWGAAIEPKHMETNQGPKWDKFALTKALNKAERNAKKKLIPEEIRQTIIAMAQKSDRVKVLEAARSEVAELPPPLTGERADGLRADIAARYEDLKKLNRQKIPPARYGAYLRRAEHDFGALERMLNWIEEMIEDEKREQGIVDSTAEEEAPDEA